MEDSKLIQLQSWLRQDEASFFNKLIHQKIASLQEESSRLLIEANEDERKLGEARILSHQAWDLKKMLELIDSIKKGDYNFLYTEISVTEELLWHQK